ncbi:MAG: hypothetical protein WC370_08360 [Dehalococcoidales bacterium]|jgi:hypothetical protein
MKKLLVISLVIMVLLLSACGGPAAATKKITLGDYVTVLDSSKILPDWFEPINVVSEGLSKSDMGLDGNSSEITAYISQLPYQVIYSYLAIIEDAADRATAVDQFTDETYLNQMIKMSLTAGFSQSEDIQIQIDYPDLGDGAVAGQGILSESGTDTCFEFFWGRSGNVFIYFYSFSYADEKQPLEPLVKEALKRLGNFTQ